MRTLKIIIFLLLVFTAVSLNAQDFKIGIVGGINFSSASMDPENEDIIEKEFPRISAVAEYNLGKKFWISSSFGYLGTGYTFTDFSECYVKLNYFQIDLSAKYKFGSFYCFAGPTIGFFLNGKKNLVTSLEYNSSTEEYYYVYEKTDITKDDVTSTNIGMNIGLGLDIPLNKKAAILLQGEYAFGITDVIKESETTLKMRGLSFQTGIKLAF